VPEQDIVQRKRPVTRSTIVRGLRALGVRPGVILMVHTRMSALGWVVGGSQTVVESLLEALGPDGTLMAYVGWEDDPYHLQKWPREWQQAYRTELPPFDPELTAADPEMGRIPERIRTWPGARVSTGHVFRMAALGSRAEWLTADQPWEQPQGRGSPLAKLVEADGQVLMLGAPLETLTILHHAESLVESPLRREVTFEFPIREAGRVAWRTIRDFDTSSVGAFPYEPHVPGGVDAFEVIGEAALQAGFGRRGKVGEADSVLFEARPLVRFAVQWLVERFGGGAD
jgi:aminoglycoside 3-N-acetyltransferase